MKRSRTDNGATLLEYHAAYYPIEDGWYMARVLDFPGTISQGRTLRSARRMIRDAIRMMAVCLLERGKPLPKPKRAVTDKRAVFSERIPLFVRAVTAAIP